jgi:two-component system, oxyanion-binding sensor
MKRVTAGFMPLLDAAILIVAREKGFAEEQGIELHLVRESSWANIRDRVSVGQFDVAHMLAPLPIAQNLGLLPLSADMIAPFALGLGGNAITVSEAVWGAIVDVGGDPAGDAMRAGQQLYQLMLQRRTRGLPVLSFAVVHDYSAHACELRYWLAASGINPCTDVNITIVSPGMMADALATGAIDGFCVGEPYNSVAVARGAGRVLTTKGSIWRSSPEKVLGLTKRWAENDPARLDQLLLALHHSARWCANAQNAVELAKILHAPAYLNMPQSHFQLGLLNNDGFLQFYELAANFPWQSHALWFYAQMVRWGQVQASDEAIARVKATYRPDIYRRALRSTGVALPGASSKVEGALIKPAHVSAQGGKLVMGPDGFFDGVAFDPDRLDEYITASPFYGALHKF